MEQQQQEGRMYRGIKLADSVRLYKKNGEYFDKVRNGLDRFVDAIIEVNYDVVGEFVNNMTKLVIRCDKGHVYNTSPNNITNGYRCQKCAGNSTEQAKVNFYNVVKSIGYKVIGEYENSKTNIELQCDKNHVYSVKPNDFIHTGNRCPKCSIRNPEKAKEDFYNSVESEGYKVIGDYKGSHKKIEIQCTKNHVYSVTPSNFKSGWRCSKCSGNCPIEAEKNFYNEVESEGYKVIGKYIKSLIKVELQCDKGHLYSVIPPDFMRGIRCPNCSESKGEKIIREWLESKGIVCFAQYKFPNDTRKYDFCLPFENIIVEVHGLQHYKEIEFFSNSNLTREQSNDKRKQEFAESLGYKYIVVDYREHNPQLALERFIESYNKLNAE
ncbi:hypothetical protein [Neobacillus soli]|uniref:hypothetical protein n=1 Tax=Neobacillus soli TaxID=220688 RepID=UPI0008262EDF|nr:hypothetical protein [Neobacillus soli]